MRVSLTWKSLGPLADSLATCQRFATFLRAGDVCETPSQMQTGNARDRTHVRSIPSPIPGSPSGTPHLLPRPENPTRFPRLRFLVAPLRTTRHGGVPLSLATPAEPMLSLTLELVRHDLRAALRSRRLVVLALLFFLVGLSASLIITESVRTLQQQIIETLVAQGVPEAIIQERLINATEERTLAFVADLDDNFERYAEPLRTSITLVVFFWLALALCPWLVALSSFDLFASDLRQRTFAYSTLRVSRTQLTLSRLLSQLLVISAVFALTALAFLATTVIRLPTYAQNLSVLGFVWCLVALAVYAAPWVTLAGAVSASTRSPAASLTGTLLILLALPLLRLAPFAAESLGAPPIAWLLHLHPPTWKAGLWYGIATEGLVSVGVLLAFTAALAALALASLRRRAI